MSKTQILTGVLALVVCAGLFAGPAEAARVGGPWEITTSLAPGQRHVFQHTFAPGTSFASFIFHQYAGSTQIRLYVVRADGRRYELGQGHTALTDVRPNETMTAIVQHVGNRTTTYRLQVR